MAWYSDEQYMMIQDSREKKTIAASAFKQRSHCGKGGRVTLPSDYMSRKELKSMNGECKSYRMNDPISWAEFTEWPNEHKVAYIKRIREKFGVSDKYISEMFGVACNLFLMYVKELGLETKTECDENCEKQKFYAWQSGAKTELVSECDELTRDAEEIVEQPTYDRNPMVWKEFRLLSDEKKIEYIQWIRKTFDAPNSAIADMLGCHRTHFAREVIGRLNLKLGAASGRAKRNWENPEFTKWREMLSEKASNTPIEELVGKTLEIETEIVVPCAGPLTTVDDLIQKHVENIEDAENAFVKPQKAVEPENDIPVNESTSSKIIESEVAKGAVPIDGDLNFEGNSDDILRTIRMLLNGCKVKMTVSWRVINDEGVGRCAEHM